MLLVNNAYFLEKTYFISDLMLLVQLIKSIIIYNFFVLLIVNSLWETHTKMQKPANQVLILIVLYNISMPCSESCFVVRPKENYVTGNKSTRSPEDPLGHMSRSGSLIERSWHFNDITSLVQVSMPNDMALGNVWKFIMFIKTTMKVRC